MIMNIIGKIHYFILLIIFIFGSFFPIHLFAASPLVDIAIDFYVNSDYDGSKRIMEVVLSDKNQTPKDYESARVYLTLIAIHYNETEKADNYLREIVTLNENFQIENYQDATNEFKLRLEKVRKQLAEFRYFKESHTGIEFLLIPGGCFNMGTGIENKNSNIDEALIENICISSFYMSKYEITNAQYRMLLSNHDSQKYRGESLNNDSQPVVNVSWGDSNRFADWLSSLNLGKKFRLPTEAEWEYAARAKTSTSRFWGDSIVDTCFYANVSNKKQTDIKTCSDGYIVTAPVGSFQANPFGLYDILGNVSEWTQDIYTSDSNRYGSNKENPIYIDSTDDTAPRVHRGGSWQENPKRVRSAYRFSYLPNVRLNFIGFRLVLEE